MYAPSDWVAAAIKEKGSRTTGPERINDMLGRRALLVRRGIGRKHRWNLGMNASSGGEPQVGSRFLWEIGEWSYADPLEGQAQKQDPSDDTADGADMMAALRYAIMSWLRAAKFTSRPTRTHQPDHDHGVETVAKQLGGHYDHSFDEWNVRYKERYQRERTGYWGYRW